MITKLNHLKNHADSGGQWLKAYENTKDNFDYYIFMEDDYVPLNNNFDDMLIKIYKNKFKILTKVLKVRGVMPFERIRRT